MWGKKWGIVEKPDAQTLAKQLIRRRVRLLVSANKNKKATSMVAFLFLLFGGLIESTGSTLLAG